MTKTITQLETSVYNLRQLKENEKFFELKEKIHKARFNEVQKTKLASELLDNVFKRHLEGVINLFKLNKVNFDTRNTLGDTLLHMAVKENHYSAIKEILDENNFLIFYKNKFNQTPADLTTNQITPTFQKFYLDSSIILDLYRKLGGILYKFKDEMGLNLITVTYLQNVIHNFLDDYRRVEILDNNYSIILFNELAAAIKIQQKKNLLSDNLGQLLLHELASIIGKNLGNIETYEIIHLLDMYVTNICKVDTLGNTFIHKAIKYYNKLDNRVPNEIGEIIDQILAENSNLINIPNKSGITPFHLATSNSNYPMIKILLEYYPDINVKTDDGNTALHLISTKSKKIIKGPAGKNGQNIKEKILGSNQNIKKIVENLLDRYSNINLVNIIGDTPLHLSILAQNEDTAKMLIRKGAKLTILNNNFVSVSGYAKKYTPNFYEEILTPALKLDSILMIATTENVELNDLDFSQREILFKRVVYFLSKNNLTDKANDLKKILFFKDNEWINDRYLKAFDNSALLVKNKLQEREYALIYLEKQGIMEADLDQQDVNGNTPLHVAIKIQDIRLAKLLVSAGADLNIINNEGLNVLQLASKHLPHLHKYILIPAFKLENILDKALINDAPKNVINNEVKDILIERLENLLDSAKKGFINQDYLRQLLISELGFKPNELFETFKQMKSGQNFGASFSEGKNKIISDSFNIEEKDEAEENQLIGSVIDQPTISIN